MIDFLKRLLRSGPGIIALGVYLTLFADIVQNIFFLPYYLDVFGPELYGEWLATGGVISLVAFADIGISSLTIQKTAKTLTTDSYYSPETVLGTSLAILLVFLTVIVFILNFGVNYIFDFIGTNPNHISDLKSAFRISLFGVSLSLINNVLDGFLCTMNQEGKAKKHQLFGAIIGILTLLIGFQFYQKILLIPLSIVTRNLVSVSMNILTICLILKKRVITKSKKLILYSKILTTDYLSVIPNLLLSKLLTTINNGVESVFITKYINSTATSYYDINKKVGGLFRSVLDRIGAIMYPFLSKRMSSKGSTEDITILFQALIIVSGFIFFAGQNLNHLVIKFWVGPDYYLGDKITYLIMSSLCLGFSVNYLNYTLGTVGKFKISSNINSINSLLALVSTYLIIKQAQSIEMMLIIQSIIFEVFIIANLFVWKSILDFKKILITHLISFSSLNMLSFLNLLFDRSTNSLFLTILLLNLVVLISLGLYLSKLFKKLKSRL